MSKVEFTDLRNYIFGSTAAIITDISLIVGLGSAGTHFVSRSIRSIIGWMP